MGGEWRLGAPNAAMPHTVTPDQRHPNLLLLCAMISSQLRICSRFHSSWERWKSSELRDPHWRKCWPRKLPRICHYLRPCTVLRIWHQIFFLHYTMSSPVRPYGMIFHSGKSPEEAAASFALNCHHLFQLKIQKWKRRFCPNGCCMVPARTCPTWIQQVQPDPLSRSHHTLPFVTPRHKKLCPAI
jgi:hypothetical protein